MALKAQTKQQQLNRKWKQQKGHVSLVTREMRKSAATGVRSAGVHGTGEAAVISTAKTVKTCLRPRPRYRNMGGPLSSGANLEPVARTKRTWTRAVMDLAFTVDTTDANGDIIMADCMTSKVKVEEI